MSGVCFAFQEGDCTRGEACKFAHQYVDTNMMGVVGGPEQFYQQPMMRKNICYAFQNGECQRGTSCRYSHGDESGFGGIPRYNNNFRMGWPNQEPYPNQAPCFAFQRGECDRGSSCRFSHRGGGGGYRTQPCFAFQKGECERGASCRFSHGEQQYGAPVRFAGDQQFGVFGGGPYMQGNLNRGNQSRGVCFAFQTGNCDRGPACRFSHDMPMDGNPMAPPMKICFAFQRGQCERGDGCRYSHDIRVDNGAGPVEGY